MPGSHEERRIIGELGFSDSHDGISTARLPIQVAITFMSHKLRSNTRDVFHRSMPLDDDSPHEDIEQHWCHVASLAQSIGHTEWVRCDTSHTRSMANISEWKERMTCNIELGTPACVSTRHKHSRGTES
eukprot:scpid92209/ scgid18923/ 